MSFASTFTRTDSSCLQAARNIHQTYTPHRREQVGGPSVDTWLTRPSQIEILPAGEEGPRRLDSTTITVIAGIPTLTISEFLRAKLKAWSLYVPVRCTKFRAKHYSRRRNSRDAEDIAFTLSQYWNQVDINRIPEQDMDDFVAHCPAAAPAWTELKRKYRMCEHSPSFFSCS